MARPGVARRGRIAATAVLVVVGGLAIPTGGAVAATIGQAAGGTAISADEFGTSSYSSLTGPVIGESGAGELALGSTTVLNMPSGFRMSPSAGTISIGGAGCDLKGTLSVTSTQATFTVTHASTVAGCIVLFVGLAVQPTAGPGLVSGNITKTGTSAAPGGATNYGTLTKVAGAVAQLVYLTQPSSTNFGGIAFGTQPAVLARDQFGNPKANAPVTLSITKGTGATGAKLTCATNPIRTDGAGVANFTGDACRINLAASYRLRAASGAKAVNSGTFTVAVGPATRIAFKAYPATPTKATLAAQPRAAIVDAGGNIVTTYPPTRITLAINMHASTFKCTSGLTVTTVKGVAQFKGCRQTVLGNGYRLTAWTGFAFTTGKVFKVVR